MERHEIDMLLSRLGSPEKYWSGPTELDFTAILNSLLDRIEAMEKDIDDGK